MPRDEKPKAAPKAASKVPPKAEQIKPQPKARPNTQSKSKAQSKATPQPTSQSTQQSRQQLAPQSTQQTAPQVASPAAPPAASQPEPKARRPRAAKGAPAAEIGAAERASSATRRALLAFLSGWRQHQDGEITAGGSVVVHYDPARFPHEDPARVGAASCDIIGYARFLPGGELRHAALATLGDGNSPVPDDGSASVVVEIAVPPETEAVELWFQRTDAAGATEWDSRFGENYRFGVVRTRPATA